MLQATKIGISVFILLLIVGCERDKDFPDTPVLTIREFTKTSDATAVWRLGFTDGDGDVGVRENSLDTSNFIVSIFSIKNGQDSALSALNYRVPIVENIRTIKGIEGEIRFDIDGLDFIKAVNIDSIYYQGYLQDRAGNNSNIVLSPRIGL